MDLHKSGETMILGLDISTNCTGISVISDDGKLEYSGFIDTHATTKKKKEQFKTLYDKLDFQIKAIEDFKAEHQKFNITRVVIEDPLKKFIRGRSRVEIIMMLAKFNFALSHAVLKIFNVVPDHVNPNEIRKIVGMNTVKGQEIKPQVVKHVKLLFPETEKLFPKKLPKSTPYYDLADSVLIAFAGFLGLTAQERKKKSKKNGKQSDLKPSGSNARRTRKKKE